jgi:hypothetical protein
VITAVRLCEIERVTTDMLEIGADELGRHWAFVAAIQDQARHALAEPDSGEQMVVAVKFNIDHNYSENGSFSDWDPSGPGYARFQQLCDELAALVQIP